LSQTISTPAVPALTLGPLNVASRAGLHPSTNPFGAANIAATPSTSNPTPPQTRFFGKTTTAVTGLLADDLRGLFEAAPGSFRRTIVSDGVAAVFLTGVQRADNGKMVSIL
jgi:hypothetical protein